MKNLKYFFIIFFLISSCSGLGEAKKVLKNEKVFTTDEFLVKKKEPLTLPPNFEELPVPNQNKKENNLMTDEEKLKKILNAENKELNETTSSSSLEEKIIEKIQ